MTTDPNRFELTSPKTFDSASVFLNAAFTHQHPGWLQIDDYPYASSCFEIRSADTRQVKACFGLTHISDSFGWLEFVTVPSASFDIPIMTFVNLAARNIGFRELFFLPAESNPLTEALITAPNLRITDRIATLSNQNPAALYNTATPDITETQYSILKPASDEWFNAYPVEDAFPPLWRLSRQSFANAWHEADIRFIVRDASSNQSIGYVLASREQDANTVHLSRIAIAPAFRGQGLGSKLIRTLVKENAPLRKISVNTYARNYDALSLYKKLGFHQDTPYWQLYQMKIRVDIS